MWNHERILYKQFNTPTDIIFDGKYLIVVDAVGLHFIDYRNQRNIMTADILPEQNYELDIEKTILLQGHSVCYFNNKYYITNSEQFNELQVVSYVAGVEQTITLPETMNSNIVNINGWIWFVSKNKKDNTDEQVLYRLDDVSNIDSCSINASHQSHDRYIASDFRKNVLVTNFNSVSIAKINSETLTHVSNIRLSREPYFIQTLSDRTCYVASTIGVSDPDTDMDRVLYDGSIDADSSYDTGIVYAVDTINDVQQTNFQTLGEVQGIAHIGTDLWMSVNRKLKDNIKSLLRLNVSNNQIKFTKPYQLKNKIDPPDNTPFDWSINIDKFKEDSFGKLIKCESYDYPVWNGQNIITETVPEFIFVITDGYVQGFEIEPLYTTKSTKLYSAAMISSGAHDYTGG